MQFIRRARDWMFGERATHATWWQVIAWWEARRIPYNLVVGAWGFVSLVIFFFAIQGAGELKPGEDAVEPMALLAAPFVINACYTLGWVVEVLLRAWVPALRSERVGPKLMKLGVAFSMIVVTLPAAIWGVIWAGRKMLASR
jgi:hypothetical protein